MIGISVTVCVGNPDAIWCELYKMWEEMRVQTKEYIIAFHVHPLMLL
jgi:hypothetical protein